MWKYEAKRMTSLGLIEGWDKDAKCPLGCSIFIWKKCRRGGVVIVKNGVPWLLAC